MAFQLGGHRWEQYSSHMLGGKKIVGPDHSRSLAVDPPLPGKGNTEAITGASCGV